MESKQYSCLMCDKEYSSYMGLWKHKEKRHKPSEILNKVVTPQNRICKYCDKEFSDYRNRWRHETKYCKLNNTLNNTNDINNSGSNNKSANVNSTFNDNSQNTNIQNQTINITINEIGKEDIYDLSQDEIELVINDGLNCLITLIELLNFNKERPQNHSFCTNNLNNKYASKLNTETNEIEVDTKKNLFDKVIYFGLNNIDILTERIINKKKKKEFSDRIKDLELKIYGNNEYKQLLVDQINAISYNKRKMINKTWTDYLKRVTMII